VRAYYFTLAGERVVARLRARLFSHIIEQGLLRHFAAHRNTLQHIATHSNTLQHTATHHNALQHTTTHCNTQQHTATYSFGSAPARTFILAYY